MKILKTHGVGRIDARLSELCQEQDCLWDEISKSDDKRALFALLRKQNEVEMEADAWLRARQFRTT